MRGEVAKAVVATFNHHLLRTGIAFEGLAIVEHFISGFDHQEIPFGRDRVDFECAHFLYVLRRELIFVPGVQVLLPSDESREQFIRPNSGIQQHGTQAESSTGSTYERNH